MLIGFGLGHVPALEPITVSREMRCLSLDTQGEEPREHHDSRVGTRTLRRKGSWVFGRRKVDACALDFVLPGSVCV